MLLIVDIEVSARTSCRNRINGNGESVDGSSNQLRSLRRIRYRNVIFYGSWQRIYLVYSVGIYIDGSLSLFEISDQLVGVGSSY